MEGHLCLVANLSFLLKRLLGGILLILWLIGRLKSVFTVNDVTIHVGRIEAG